MFKVGKKFVYVQACDLCFKHKKPKDGIEICRRSTISSYGNVPVWNLCESCGKETFNGKEKR